MGCLILTFFSIDGFSEVPGMPEALEVSEEAPKMVEQARQVLQIPEPSAQVVDILE
jgi:hypothetical protein